MSTCSQAIANGLVSPECIADPKQFGREVDCDAVAGRRRRIVEVQVVALPGKAETMVWALNSFGCCLPRSLIENKGAPKRTPLALTQFHHVLLDPLRELKLFVSS
ncbi:hypothetical protein NMY22_g9212 [Coprinellus aureogranulatus]|nr:hypothetical protein NMY22_g9212 [Coprinellus aureogranulatus]